jgi:hypothetical protein
VPNLGPAPNVALAETSASSYAVKNDSVNAIWLWPPNLAVYSESHAWLTPSVDDTVAAREIPPHGTATIELTSPAGPGDRVTALIWPTTDHSADRTPWLEWVSPRPNASRTP